MKVNTKEVTNRIGPDILSDIMQGREAVEILKKYGISEVQFSQIKEILLRKVKSQVNSADITTHAIRYFRTLVKERTFTVRTQELGLTVTQQKLLYNIISGRTRATYGTIFTLRSAISPSQWVYKEYEELPEPVEFTPLVEKRYPHYDFDSRNELAKESTLGNIFFDVLKERRALSRLCALHDYTRFQAGNFVYMKRHKNGELRYLVRPTLPFMEKFREEVHPDWWFIYPDEVTEDYIMAVQDKANECALAVLRH